jgi:hypothetical protein
MEYSIRQMLFESNFWSWGLNLHGKNAGWINFTLRDVMMQLF